MGQHASYIERLKLVKEIEKSAGRDDISEADVKQLSGMIVTVADTAGELLKRIPQTFKQYTEHDISHCHNVISLMGKFIPRETLRELNGLELAVMVLAALLHDFGMFVSDREKEEALKSESFRQFLSGHLDRASAIAEARTKGMDYRASLIEDALLAEYFRRLHPQRVKHSIKENLPGKLVFREQDLSGYVAQVCESHGWGVQESSDPLRPDKAVSKLDTSRPVYGVPVNLQYIACCLRLADIMDFDRSRTPMVVFQNIEFTEKKSWEEWNKHLQISGWVVKEREVEYVAECKHPSFYVAVMEFLDWIDAELRQCRQLIVKQAPKEIAERYKLHLPPVVERWKVEMADKRFLAGGFRFQLEYERIMQLLMDKSLYPDPSLFLRELLQNSLDACRNREALAKEAQAAYTPRIVVWDYSSDATDPRIVFQDNGMGMSQRIVENYFMRVGRSYYRSGEFEAERQRLKEKDIELEATSQFGIGILSCFMVADRFEVETYRRGNNPLHVTIEGPTKYFTIEVLDRPPVKDFEPPPESDKEDGPPARPGTRITVHLREGVELDAYQVLETFAVNVEYDIQVYKADVPAPQIIPRRRWELVEIRLVDFPDAIKERVYVYSEGGLPETRSPVPTWAVNLNDVLVASRVPLEKHRFSSHLSGTAWFWLLRDADGKPCPQRGYLQISQFLTCIGMPRLMGMITSVLDIIEKLPRKWKEFVSILRLTLEEDEKISSSKRARDIMRTVFQAGYRVHSFSLEWDSISRTERKKAIEILENISFPLVPWFERDGTPMDLLDGKLKSTSESLSFHGHVYLNPLPQSLALHGIRVPAGALKYDPMAGNAFRIRLMPMLSGGVLVDALGVDSPVPAANRLFIDVNEALKIQVPLARAALHHACELALHGASNSAWREWLGGTLVQVGSFHMGVKVLSEELELLDRSPNYLLSNNNDERVWLSRNELLAKYGRWVPLSRNREKKIRGKHRHIMVPGLVIYDTITQWLLINRPKRKRIDETWEVDLESTISIKADSFQAASRIWLSDIYDSESSQE